MMDPEAEEGGDVDKKDALVAGAMAAMGERDRQRFLRTPPLSPVSLAGWLTPRVLSWLQMASPWSTRHGTMEVPVHPLLIMTLFI